jgi:glycosyltransferase involved in cell wall biosynthesis
VKRWSDILAAVEDSRWSGAAVRVRGLADRWAADAWLALRRRPGRAADPALVRDAMDAALLPPGTVVKRVDDVAEQAPAAVPAALARLAADAGALVVVVPVWPAGRGAVSSRTRTLRRSGWWHAAAAEAGLEPWVELRREAGGHACLVLRRPGPASAPPARAPGRGAEPHIRIRDDLSRATSFTWITASIALALERIGTSVSIAPTELSPSIEPERRRALAALVERGGSVRGSEVGWTHFWPEYRRRLGGAHPLALFAVNYGFAGSELDGWDPWMRELVEGDMPLGPISTFCADVLAEAGVPRERLDLVPLAPTEGLERAEPAEIPRARALKLLHVTNAMDAQRHGTDVALSAFGEAFAPGDDVTLVVRDYAVAEPGLAAAVARLATRGFDVRYWPAFYPAHRLGTFMGAFDALVAPFRGEGFGIKLLDAMACGVPVIGPRFGGPADFLDDAGCYAVPHRLEPVTAGYDAGRLALGNRPLWAQVAPADVAARLRECRDDPGGLADRAVEARRVATERFSWERTARAIVESVQRRQG